LREIVKTSTDFDHISIPCDTNDSFQQARCADDTTPSVWLRPAATTASSTAASLSTWPLMKGHKKCQRNIMREHYLNCGTPRKPEEHYTRNHSRLGIMDSTKMARMHIEKVRKIARQQLREVRKEQRKLVGLLDERVAASGRWHNQHSFGHKGHNLSRDLRDTHHRHGRHRLSRPSLEAPGGGRTTKS